VALLLLSVAQASPAQGQETARPIALAVQASEAPTIDGVLDDRVWQNATPLTGFTQAEPFEGQPASEGGREDVYVAAFPRYDGRRRISAGGGSWSRWRRDGREIFYLDPENRLVAVPVTRTGSGVDPGGGRPLFATGARPDRGYAYDVSADGERILVNTPR